MKTVIFFAIIIIGAGYYFYQKDSSGIPEAITDPYFGELTVKQKVQNRDLTVVVYGRMVDNGDCEKRGQIALKDVFEGCTDCNVVDYHCQTELPRRAQALFDNQSTHLAYIALDRGNRGERDARMIVWGLTKAESAFFCTSMIPMIKKKYSGTVSCIEALERS
jgi:hypothetical protein